MSKQHISLYANRRRKIKTREHVEVGAWRFDQNVTCRSSNRVKKRSCHLYRTIVCEDFEQVSVDFCGSYYYHIGSTMYQSVTSLNGKFIIIAKQSICSDALPFIHTCLLARNMPSPLAEFQMQWVIVFTCLDTRKHPTQDWSIIFNK